MPPCFSRPNANRGVIDLKSRAFVSPYCPSA
ncbi:hypothetical protein VDGD_20412 [Verticillium dahliae]|nr:hypothetical protein VDGD_20412 [Verticillium dahliae]